MSLHCEGGKITFCHQVCTKGETGFDLPAGNASVFLDQNRLKNATVPAVFNVTPPVGLPHPRPCNHNNKR